MSFGASGLECPRCGQLRVVFYLRMKGAYAVIKAVCPNCASKKAFRLSVDLRDNWIGPVTDQIYRCASCGVSIRDPVKIGREGRWIVLFLECPTHGLKDGRRHILDTIYPAIESIHQNPMREMRAPATFSPPRPAYAPPPPPPAMGNTYSPNDSPAFAPPPPPPDAFRPPVGDNGPATVQFCPDCGAKLQPGALFCTSCGMALDDNYDEY